MRTPQKKFTMLALLALSHPAMAEPPLNAGSQIQQIPPSPAPAMVPPQIHFEPSEAPTVPMADEQQVLVRQLRITGAKACTEADLLGVAGFVPGRAWTLSSLQAMAARIAEHYRGLGYFVAQAYLPAQDIQDGVVTVAVMEGEYGAITLRNQSSLSDGLARQLLGGLKVGEAILAKPLERSLLLLSDLPGVAVKSTLMPGASLGTSDLLVAVEPGQRTSGSIDADNQGSRYTGDKRLGATVNLNNPAGHGDVVSLRVLTGGEHLNYGRAGYQVQVGEAKLGMAYASMKYTLGREFESLRFKGSTQIASVYGNYPLIRSRSHNLHAQLAFDDKVFEDRQAVAATVTEKKARVWMASLNGDHRDAWGGGASSSYSFTATSGRLDAPLTPARSSGSYQKLAFSASRLQSLDAATSVYTSITVQAASKNLDSSEKLGLGGAAAVRAYPDGAVYGDEGRVLTLELRRSLPSWSERLPGQFQLTGFADTGIVTLNKRPWDTARNRQTLSGAGVGLNWVGDDRVVVKAHWAHALGRSSTGATLDSTSRFSIQVVKYF